MAIDIGDAILKIGVDKKDFNRDMKGLSGAIRKHKKAIGVAMIGIGVAAIGAAAASIKAFASMGDEVQKMALRTGLSTEALSELRHAAEISGASLSTIEKGIKKMSKTIVDADEGMATYIRSFDRIGLSAEALMKLSPEDQFTRITEAIADLESPTLRAATAQDIFGRAGTELLPLMAAGSEGLADLRKEAHELGIVFDQEAADSAANFNDSLTRLNSAINGAKFTLARELMPAMEEAIPLLEQWAKALGPIITNTLNWFAAEDKQIRVNKQWRAMQHERFLFRNKQNNQFEESINLLESMLYNQGSLTDETQRTIDMLKKEIEVRKDQEEVIEDVNEDLEEQIALQKEQQEAYEKTTELIKDAIEELEYEESVAGELRLTIDDVIKAMYKMGRTTDDMTETMAALGDEQDNVNAVLEAFGVTAIEVAEALGIETEEVLKLEGAYEELGKMMKTTALSAAEMKAALRAKAVSGVKLGEEEILVFQRQKISEYRAAHPESITALQRGGIVMRPILAQIAERVPEAVIPLDKLGMIGGVTVTGNTFNIRRESDIDKVAEAIIHKARQKTGLKL